MPDLPVCFAALQNYYDNRYWTMWKLPMFGCTDPIQVRPAAKPWAMQRATVPQDAPVLWSGLSEAKLSLVSMLACGAAVNSSRSGPTPQPGRVWSSCTAARPPSTVDITVC
jgi:hypothetical protein